MVIIMLRNTAGFFPQVAMAVKVDVHATSVLSDESKGEESTSEKMADLVSVIHVLDLLILKPRLFSTLYPHLVHYMYV